MEEFPDFEEDNDNSSGGGATNPKDMENDEDYATPESEETPETDNDEDENTEDNGDPNDDAETVTGNGNTPTFFPTFRPTFFHCIMGGYGPFGPVRNIGHIGFGAIVPAVGRTRPRVPKLISSIPLSFPLGLQGTYTTMVCLEKED